MYYPTKSPTIWIKVEGSEMAESGRRVDFSFELKVKRLTFPELQAIYDRAREDGLSDFECLKDLVLDWRGIGSPDDGPTPYSAEELKVLFDALGGAPFVGAFNRAMPRAKEKN